MSIRAIVLLGAAALVAAGCQGDKTPKPPIHPNWNMDQTARIDPQEPFYFFENGMGQRAYVEGTVARGQLRTDDHLNRGKDAKDAYVDALPPQDEAGNAIVADAAFIKRGEERYQIYCAPCHNNDGNGKGIIIQRAMKLAEGNPEGLGFNPPPSFHDDRLLKEPLGKFYDVITNGWGNMQPYKSQITNRDRWAVAAYVRSMQKTKK